MNTRILFDGLHLSLKTGTGIATYARNLASVAKDLDYRVSVACSLWKRPPPDRRLLEAMLFEEPSGGRGFVGKWRDRIEAHTPFGASVDLVDATPSGVVDMKFVQDRISAYDRIYAGYRIFDRARQRFDSYKAFTALRMGERPDIAHFTFPMPLKAKGAVNVYTIHDLVPLKLPFATLDHRKYFFDLHARIARDADHIVTVSETSRRDIIEILKVDEDRVTNTYQAVSVPAPLQDIPLYDVANELRGMYGLELGGYFLFFGAIEPKKNVRRLLEAYVSAKVKMPMVLVSSSGWQNEAEMAMIDNPRFSAGGDGPRIIRLSYVSHSQLVGLIRGARAVTFPSLYEGFGLPVLEAMLLGAPVLASNTSSVPEVAGDAALLVDPLDVDSIRSGLRTLAADSYLCDEMSKRGRARAALFSPEAYKPRVDALYKRLA